MKCRSYQAREKKYHTKPKDLGRNLSPTEASKSFLPLTSAELGCVKSYLQNESLDVGALDGNHPKKAQAC